MKQKQLKTLAVMVTLAGILSACGGSSTGKGPGDFNPDVSVLAGGNFVLESSTCDTNGTSLSIVQNEHALWLKGGFDYGQNPPANVKYPMIGVLDDKNNVQFEIYGASGDISCAATLVEPALQGTCTLPGGDTCDFSFKRGAVASLSTSICIDAPDAACSITYSCYDCAAHSLVESPVPSDGCVVDTFEKKCRGEIDSVSTETVNDFHYYFVDGCVFVSLKKECLSLLKRGLTFTDVCPNSLSEPFAAEEGCNVEGYSMYCTGFSVLTCDGDERLPYENVRNPHANDVQFR
jgi:hypothetical protein